MSKVIKIGGASGYWGESAMATPQLLASGELDYIIYDYLAEITMSIMARARARDADKGYATDFIDSAMRPNLKEITRQGVKIIANAGGVNPMACANALRALIKAQGLNLKVGVITGDNLMQGYDSSLEPYLEANESYPTDMYSGQQLKDRETVASANVYLGAFPIAQALNAGADIVITGRCVDSALTLGACIHEFRVPPLPNEQIEGYNSDGYPIYEISPIPTPDDTNFAWSPYDFNRLASGSLAGHILECGPQATGGNFTDWDSIADIAHIGYPIADINADGSFIVSKPKGTGGTVNVGTVSEQMLYEIGNPRAYALPDVICDFSDVKITQSGKNTVHVSPAKGRQPTDKYKTSLTYFDGFRAGQYMTLYGGRATEKAEVLADAILTRSRERLQASQRPDFVETSIEILGSGSQLGERYDSDEVMLKLAVKHEDAVGVGIFLKEMAGIGLATPPGLSGFTGSGRAKPSPIIRLMSFMTPKSLPDIKIDIEGEVIPFFDISFYNEVMDLPPAITPRTPSEVCEVNVPLRALAWGRSGDKGDKANIGIIARDAEFLPFIWNSLTCEAAASRFSHFMADTQDIERFYLPGSHAINFLLDYTLGGGGAASLRNDAQAKGYAQILLTTKIAVPQRIAAMIDHPKDPI